MQERNEQPKSGFRADAERFLANLQTLEETIESFSLRGPVDEVMAAQLRDKLQAAEVLRFVAWCTNIEPEGIRKKVIDQGLSTESVEKVLAFAEKYRLHADLFGRLLRAAQGYENEITSISARPMLYIKSGDLVVDLTIYSFGKTLVRSHQGLGGLLEVVQKLAETVCEIIEDADKSYAGVGSRAADREAVEGISKAIKRLQTILSASAGQAQGGA